ncbi:MAG: PAS domain-containing protein [Proteobacteria bacterium]|nr:PAS domain-containing protein [Pseudomonadota bacterium]
MPPLRTVMTAPILLAAFVGLGATGMVGPGDTTTLLLGVFVVGASSALGTGATLAGTAAVCVASAALWGISDARGLVATVIGAGLGVLIAGLLSFDTRAAPAPEPESPATPDTPEPVDSVEANLPDWILRVDLDFRLQTSNHPSAAMFPDVSDGHIGKPVVELFDAHLHPILKENLARSVKLVRQTSFEYYLRDDQKLYFAEMRIIPARNGLWLISRDITAKRGREDALRESKERFALAVQGANDGLWDWDLLTNEVYYSHAWKRQLGHEAEDVGNQPEEWLDRVHPEDAKRVKNDLQAHLDGHAPRYESEHRIRDKDGDWMWVLTRGMAVRDAKGRAKRIAGSMTDLTQRRVVAATAEKSRLLEHATRAVGIGIAMRTRKHKLVDPSPMLREIVEAWKNVDDWWASLQNSLELPPSVDCPSCSAKQVVGSTRVTVLDPKGQQRVFELTFTGHGHEVQHDQLVNVLLIEDVTTAALAEARLHSANTELVAARDEALASSRAKSAFLANMSHELRTPLNAIIGYSEMLLEDAEEEGSSAEEDLRRIHGAGSHLLGLIAGILDLSKVEAGMMQIDLQDLDVHELVQQVSATATPLVRTNQFELDVVDDLGRMRTDAVKLRQILLNLLNNAFKFTDEGTVKLVVRADITHITFRVQDTGIGIAEDARESLFEEFVQGDLSSTKAFQGAGLGLALVRRFSEILGASVSVESALGEGTTFTVLLPRDHEEDPDTETLELLAPEF